MYKYSSHIISLFEALLISILLATIFSSLAFFGVFGRSNDYDFYLNYFDYNIDRVNCFDGNIFNFEAGFDVTSCLLVSTTKSPILVYSFFILVSTLVKLIVIYITLLKTKSTNSSFLISYLLCILLYFSRFFPLHELTQTRASLSIMFLLVGSLVLLSKIKSTHRLSEVNPWVLALYLTACLFHSSILLVLPLILAAFYVKSRKNMVIFSIIVFVLFKILFSQYIFKIIVDINPRLFDYIDNTSYLDISILSPKRALDFYLIMIGVVYYDVENKFQLFYMSLTAFSIACFYGLVDTPTIAYRMSEIIQVFSISFVATMRSSSQITLVIPYTVAMLCISIYSFFHTGGFFSS